MSAFATCANAEGRAFSPKAPPIIIRIETTAGNIRAELDGGAAPVTVCNFLRYARGGQYDGGSFYRTVVGDRPGGNPVPIDVVQAGARDEVGLDLFGPIALERTSTTGLRHKAGALSMARLGPDTANSSFFIVLSDAPELDFGGRRNPDGQGFAAFGRVVSGMDVVRKIHQAPARGENLTPPIRILRLRVSPPRAGLHQGPPGCADVPASKP